MQMFHNSLETINGTKSANKLAYVYVCVVIL